jgi:hypothetical protein
MLKPDKNGFKTTSARDDYLRALWMKPGATRDGIMRDTGYSDKIVSAAMPRSLKVRRAKDAFKMSQWREAPVEVVVIELQSGIYLDGFSGAKRKGDIEVATDRNKAWPMSRKLGERRLTAMKTVYPDAQLVPVPGRKPVD